MSIMMSTSSRSTEEIAQSSPSSHLLSLFPGGFRRWDWVSAQPAARLRVVSAGGCCKPKAPEPGISDKPTTPHRARELITQRKTVGSAEHLSDSDASVAQKFCRGVQLDGQQPYGVQPH